MSPCSAKIASASRRKSSQPSRSPWRPKPAVAARKGPGSLAERPACPRCRSSRARRAAAAGPRGRTSRRCRVLGICRRRDQDRPVLDERPGADQDPLGAARRPACAPCPRVARRLARLSASNCSRSWRGCRRPACGARRRGSRSTPGSRPTSWRCSTPRPAAVEWKPQPEHFDTPTYSSGASLARFGRTRISLEGRERVGAAFVVEVLDLRRCRCGPGGRPAARRRSARRASRRSRAGGVRFRWRGCRSCG